MKIIAVGFTTWCLVTAFGLSLITNNIEQPIKETPGIICTQSTGHQMQSIRCIKLQSTNILKILKQKADESGCRNALIKNTLVMNCENRI